jgi:hypothetical protein
MLDLAPVARVAFCATVLSYVDTPTVHQGRLPGVGMDCPGPLICAAWAHGLKPRSFNVTGYGRVPDGKVLQGLLEEHLQRIHYDDRLPGDVPLVRFQQGRPQHMGILVETGAERQYWVEAEGYRHKRVLKARFILGDRSQQLVAMYRVPGLAP